MPESETICGEPGASSETVKLAARWPGPMGLKTREIAQLAAGATGAVQLLVEVKSEGLGPLRETEEIWSGAVPELITVNVWAAPEVPSVIVGDEGTVGGKGSAAAGARAAAPIGDDRR